MLVVDTAPKFLYSAKPIEDGRNAKLHACTLPRKRPDSRVKDLPDIALLAGVRERMVDEDELGWADLATLTLAVEAFLNPVLDGTALGSWTPSTWRWA